MKIIVMSRKDARIYSFKNHDEKSIMVSITDVCSQPNYIQTTPENGIKYILPLQFDDVELGCFNCITKTQAEKIASFILNTKDAVDTIIVHCEAGVSRSAGVAAAIGVFVNHDDSFIFDSPRYVPNMTCYRAVLNAFVDRMNNLEESEKIASEATKEVIAAKEQHNIDVWKKFNKIDDER